MSLVAVFQYTKASKCHRRTLRVVSIRLTERRPEPPIRNSLTDLASMFYTIMNLNSIQVNSKAGTSTHSHVCIENAIF
jgi:hypothetical protein